MIRRKDLGRRIRQLREKKGILTTTAWATATSISEATLKTYELNTATPSSNNYNTITTALKLPYPSGTAADRREQLIPHIGNSACTPYKRTTAADSDYMRVEQQNIDGN
jgi:hypothetical protein